MIHAPMAARQASEKPATPRTDRRAGAFDCWGEAVKIASRLEHHAPTVPSRTLN